MRVPRALFPLGVVNHPSGWAPLTCAFTRVGTYGGAPAVLRRLRPLQWHPSVPARRDQQLRPPDRSAPCWVRVLVSVQAPNEQLQRSGQIFGV
ncbi:hypothetical protein NDU88_000793 [Pleurodeles waltl]|uniref:Uncharacterized protein n=1 Tax=Pleurodeles waltl TaxID=8319 RepID=A0AAV7TGG0_PLEWA|nr:hypothetical protein NDU88_000793 [Pleurodeles waltl]